MPVILNGGLDMFFNIYTYIIDNHKLKINKIVFLIPIIVFLTSCNEAIFDKGNIQLKEIETRSFKNIEINDIFTLYLYQDTTQKIVVKGGSNLIPNLTFDVDRNGTLKITDLNTARWSRDYEKIELHITVDTLHFLTLNAPVALTCIDTIITKELIVFSITDYADITLLVNCDNLYLVNSGTSGGQVTIKGTTYNFSFWARASLQIFAGQLTANRITAKNESIGDCYIHATEYLSAEILKSGFIYYKGNPEIIEYINEEAQKKLIKLD